MEEGGERMKEKEGRREGGGRMEEGGESMKEKEGMREEEGGRYKT